MPTLVCTQKIFYAGRLWSPGETREAAGGEPKCSFSPVETTRVEVPVEEAPAPTTLREVQGGGPARFSDQLLGQKAPAPKVVKIKKVEPVEDAPVENPVEDDIDLG